MEIEHIHCCRCGHNQSIDKKYFMYGRIVQCDGCKKVFTRVYPDKGGDAWIEISKKDVEFYNLLDISAERI